ncbi:NADH-quinone oxidoreductase subunit L [Candidatus Hartigia pinicola]|nr:NADH-quinone oxidoreductase subunit L [Candidatus Hartigia pinicola]
MNLLYLIIFFPLLGFVILALSRGYWSENITAIIGVGSIGITAIVTNYVGFDFLEHKALISNTENTFVYKQLLWTWISISDFIIPFTLHLDGLSLTMISIVTNVGFLIQIYASWYMRGKEGYSRFFTYTNLFIASMIILILAENMMLMYLGWEWVGLCSYLLINFYYTKPDNGTSAMKAFFITRLGDVFLAIGMFILWNALGTLNFNDIAVLAPQKITQDSTTIIWATVMILIGAVGKSAQIPLHTWLADAMVGPAPVSALIHSATMVTSGVYLIARTHVLFLMAPDILNLVGIIGGITLLLAGCAALVQTDIKRILAYSTISQISYMFLALGVQAWDAAIFHLMTHAFFKALLFLSAGSVIIACNHEQNIFKMGGLSKQIPYIYILMLIGGSALSALPWFTAGFYSKDAILWGVNINGQSILLWLGLIGTLLTAMYTFRMIFIVFHGKKKIKAQKVKGFTHSIPLGILAILATFIGAKINQPLDGIFPLNSIDYVSNKVKLEILSGSLAIIGLLIVAFIYLFRYSIVNTLSKNTISRFFLTLCYHAWGFECLYNIVFIKPFKSVAWLLESDPVNSLMNLPVFFCRWANKGLAVSENGQVRWYTASLGLGAVLILALLLLV